MKPRHYQAAARVKRYRRRVETQRERVILAVVDAMPDPYEAQLAAGRMTRAEAYAGAGMEPREICGFRVDYPGGRPRFVCTAAPHPDRPTVHGDWLGMARYNESTDELVRGLYYVGI